MNTYQTEFLKTLQQLPLFFYNNPKLLKKSKVLNVHVNKLGRDLAMLKAFTKHKDINNKPEYVRNTIISETTNLIKSISDLLQNSIDKDMEQYKTTDHDLYISYQEIRNIA